jgi:molecular chaperone DnaJ
METSNPYNVLGVKEGCSEEELKKAYKAKCFEFHPDRFGSKSKEEQDAAEVKFKQVQAAYSSINDGSYQQEKAAQGNSSFFTEMFSGFVNSVFRRQRPEKPKNVQVSLDPIVISFKESIVGYKKPFNYELDLHCLDCLGTAVKETTKKCGACNGTGSKVLNKRGMIVQTECNVCHGTGFELERCPSCTGTGKIVYHFQDELSCEPCKPQGRKFVRTISGVELEFFVPVKVNLPADFHLLDGRELGYNASIPFTDFLLGGMRNISLDDGLGYVSYSFKPGEQMVTVSGKGLPNNGKRGDLKINISPIYPSKLSEEQKDLINKLKATGL